MHLRTLHKLHGAGPTLHYGVKRGAYTRKRGRSLAELGHADGEGGRTAAWATGQLLPVLETGEELRGSALNQPVPLYTQCSPWQPVEYATGHKQQAALGLTRSQSG